MYIKLEILNTNEQNLYYFLETKSILSIKFRFKRIIIKTKHKLLPLVFTSTWYNREHIKQIDVILNEKTYGE